MGKTESNEPEPESGAAGAGGIERAGALGREVSDREDRAWETLRALLAIKSRKEEKSNGPGWRRLAAAAAAAEVMEAEVMDAEVMDVEVEVRFGSSSLGE